MKAGGKAKFIKKDKFGTTKKVSLYSQNCFSVLIKIVSVKIADKKRKGGIKDFCERLLIFMFLQGSFVNWSIGSLLCKTFSHNKLKSCGLKFKKNSTKLKLVKSDAKGWS